MQKRTIIFLIILALIAGIFLGRWVGHSTSSQNKPMYWIDTMEPTIHYSGPGKSRMGMELVPVYPESQQGDTSSVRISPAVINNLGVRTTQVLQGALAKRLEAVGYVEPDENQISHIHSYADGWVRKLFVNTVGEPVKKDQVLLQLYSPVLINAQEEYLIALRNKDKDLADESIRKLQALHISPQQIQQLVDTKKSSPLVDLVSPQDGVVTELNVREGMHVTPDTDMVALVNLANIWMIAQVFEEQASWVKVGELAEAKLSAFPNKTWKGEVEYIYPQVDPTTRTLKVRFRFNNADGILKPNMYATISLFAEPEQNVLSIPLEALIRSSQGDRVIISLGNGRFQVRSVTTGIESGDQIQIVSGLKVGESVVASGQFLIDSEANLEAGLERVATPVQGWSNIVIEGKGIIKALNASQHSLTLQHEPIPALSWPQMTMDFSVDNTVDFHQLKMGDHVKFTLKKDASNDYIITEIKQLMP